MRNESVRNEFFYHLWMVTHTTFFSLCLLWEVLARFKGCARLITRLIEPLTPSTLGLAQLEAWSELGLVL